MGNPIDLDNAVQPDVNLGPMGGGAGDDSANKKAPEPQPDSPKNEVKPNPSSDEDDGVYIKMMESWASTMSSIRGSIEDTLGGLAKQGASALGDAVKGAMGGLGQEGASGGEDKAADAPPIPSMSAMTTETQMPLAAVSNIGGIGGLNEIADQVNGGGSGKDDKQEAGKKVGEEVGEEVVKAAIML